MFLYLVAVSGVMVQLHYCGADLSSWNVYAQNEGCPDGECEDAAGVPDDCCKDKTVAAKVSVDQNITSFFELQLLPAEVPPTVLPVIYEHRSANTGVVNTITNYPNAPPGPWQQIPLFKLHSSFTYYG